MTAFDFVTTFARLHGFTGRSEGEAERVLDFVNLKDVMHTQIGRYSKGMRQRVKIAHALVNDPTSSCSTNPSRDVTPWHGPPS